MVDYTAIQKTTDYYFDETYYDGLAQDVYCMRVLSLSHAHHSFDPNLASLVPSPTPQTQTWGQDS